MNEKYKYIEIVTSIMRKVSLSIIFFLIFFQFVLAEKTTFEAYFPGAENHSIQCYFNTDFISNYREMKMDEVIDENGYFSVDFELAQTTYVSFEIDFYATGFYLEPGRIYHVKTDSLFLSEEFRPFYSKEPLLIDFNVPDSTDLNYLISELNWEIDIFLENFNAIYLYRKNHLVDSLKIKLEKKYSNVENDFFENYLHYKLANIYFAGKSVNRYELFRNNIKDREILYTHPEYMLYFNTYFDQYLLSGSKQISRYDLIISINYDRSYSALMDTLGKDSLLLNDRLRELVMLKGLKEIYSDVDFSQMDIERIIMEVIDQTPFPEHKIIASNLLNQLTALKNGSAVPDFALKEIKSNDVYSISDFFGKPIVLNFMTMKSFSCQAEMKIIHELNQKFNDSVLFVTLCYFDDQETWQKFTAENNYSWIFLWADLDAKLRNDYRLRSFACFCFNKSERKNRRIPSKKT